MEFYKFPQIHHDRCLMTCWWFLVNSYCIIMIGVLFLMSFWWFVCDILGSRLWCWNVEINEFLKKSVEIKKTVEFVDFRWSLMNFRGFLMSFWWFSFGSDELLVDFWWIVGGLLIVLLWLGVYLWWVSDGFLFCSDDCSAVSAEFLMSFLRSVEFIWGDEFLMSFCWVLMRFLDLCYFGSAPLSSAQLRWAELSH